MTAAVDPQTRGLLRVVTAGSVDDGKSTLVGRLLYDSRAVMIDQMTALEEASERLGYDGAELALLTDGLRSEREQGITIDVAYRYFATAHRSFVLADTPGHVQYTRNMVTGASTADVAVVLVDARAGVLEQTRRHLAVAALLRVGRIVLAVNKMDLVDFSEERFDEVAETAAEVLAALRFPAGSNAERAADSSHLTAVPVVATAGDNVVTRSERMPWYAGTPLLELLESVSVAQVASPGARFPVQLVIRPRTAEFRDFRGYAGRAVSGALQVGDSVTVLPSGRTSTVTSVETADGPLPEAALDHSVVLRLADDLDISRGDVIVGSGAQPAVTRSATATLCWLAEEPLSAGRHYRVRHATRDVRGTVTVQDRLDVSTLASSPATELGLNDLGRVTLNTTEPLVIDRYSDSPRTGSLVLVDEHTGATVAAGMVESTS
jgi:sulfate adenylyltransferase subunit 1